MTHHPTYEDTDSMPFGPHKGKFMSEVPDEWLQEWMSFNAHLRKETAEQYPKSSSRYRCIMLYNYILNRCPKELSN